MFYIKNADHPDLIKQFNRFRDDLKEVSKDDIIMHEMFIEGEVAKTESEFLYEWLWKVE